MELSKPTKRKRKEHGVWSGNQFWKESKTRRKGFVFSFRGLREWQKRNPEEAKRINERWEKEKAA